MHIVLDTKVLVSGLTSARAAPGRIVDLLRTGRITLVLDDRIFAEYHEVLARPHLSAYFRKSEVSHILDYISHCAYRVIVIETIRGLPDPGDLPFLEVAWAVSIKGSPISGAEYSIPLVTGNARHSPRELCRGIQVLSPAGFIESYRFPEKETSPG